MVHLCNNVLHMLTDEKVICKSLGAMCSTWHLRGEPGCSPCSRLRFGPICFRHFPLDYGTVTIQDILVVTSATERKLTGPSCVSIRSCVVA